MYLIKTFKKIIFSIGIILFFLIEISAAARPIEQKTRGESSPLWGHDEMPDTPARPLLDTKAAMEQKTRGKSSPLWGCGDFDSAGAHFRSVREDIDVVNGRSGLGGGRFLAGKLGVKSGYREAARYFRQRYRPPRHFFDMGAGLSPVLFYPPGVVGVSRVLSFFVNYRARGKRFKGVSFILGSMEYRPDFEGSDEGRWSLLTGVRYPSSSDLKRFYLDVLAGVSVLPFNFSFDIPLEFRLWLTHIVSPSDFPIRFYVQWGFPVQARHGWTIDEWEWSVWLSGRAGLDFHL